MRVFENTPEKNPRAFYLPRDTGAVDGRGDPVLVRDVPVEVRTNANNTVLKRMCKEGIQELRIFPSGRFPIKLLVNDVLLVEQAVFIETSPDGLVWATPATIAKTIDIANDGAIDALVSLGRGVYLSVACNWNSFLPDPEKQQFIANAPGLLVRIAWYIKAHDPVFNMRYDDFTGNVSYEVITGTPDIIKVIFEPQGVQDYLEV